MRRPPSPAPRRFMLAALCLLLAGFVGLRSAFALSPQQHRSSAGIPFWLVEDPATPMVALSFSLRGGWVNDPAERKGLARVSAQMLSEGAGPYDTAAFKQELEQRSIELFFGVDRDRFRGTVYTLKRNADEAARLARLALIEPRLEAPALARVRDQAIAGIRAQATDPGYLAGRALLEGLFGTAPFAGPGEGTEASLAQLTPEDVRGYLGRTLTRNGLNIGIVGRLNPAEAGQFIDAIFAGLPAEGGQAELPAPALKALGETIQVKRALPQTTILAAQPGLPRQDPDWYAASLINYALGGGGFASRLMEEVREKRGLTYGVGSGLTPSREAPLWQVSAATSNATREEALKLIREEWARMGREGPTADELAKAKTYLKGALALQLTSSDRIARMLVQVQDDGLTPDYFAQRNDLFDRVTLADAKRVAQRLKPDQLATVLVGPEIAPAAATAPAVASPTRP